MKKNYSLLKCIALLLIFSQNVAEARQASIILAEATGSTNICGGKKECISLRQGAFNNTISFFKKELERSGELLGIFSVGFDDSGGNRTEWLKENLTKCGKISLPNKHRNYIVKIDESKTASSWQTSGVAFLMSSAMSGDSLEPHPLMKYIAVELLEKCTDYVKLNNITELKVISISDTLINNLEKDVKKYITVFDTEPVGKPRGEWIFMGNKKMEINKKINNNHSVNGNEWLWKRDIYMKSKGTITQYDTSLEFEVAQQGDYELLISKITAEAANTIACDYTKVSSTINCSIKDKYNTIFPHNGEYTVTVNLNGSYLKFYTINAKKIKKWEISPSKLKFQLKEPLFSDNLFVDNQPLCDSSSNEDKKTCHVSINLLKIIDEKNSYVYNNKALVGKIVIEKSSLNIDSISKNWGFLGLTVTGTGSFLPNSELDMIFGTNQIQCHSKKTVWECKKNWGFFDFSTDNFDLVLQDPHLRAIKKNIKISLFERILINPIGVIVLLLLTAIFVLFFRYCRAFKTPPKVINR